MNNFKHTPGPWITCGCSGRMIQPEEEAGTDYFIADVDIMDNARLIAAAPEMLEALITAYFASENTMPMDILLKMREVIEKATGRSMCDIIKQYDIGG